MSEYHTKQPLHVRVKRMENHLWGPIIRNLGLSMPNYYLATEIITSFLIHFQQRNLYFLPFGGFLDLTALKDPSVLLLLRLEKFLIRKATLFNLIPDDLPTTDKLWIDII